MYEIMYFLCFLCVKFRLKNHCTKRNLFNISYLRNALKILILFIIFPLKKCKRNFDVNFHMKLQKTEPIKYPTGDLQIQVSIWVASPHYLPVQSHHNNVRRSLVVVIKLNCKCWLSNQNMQGSSEKFWFP